MSNNIRILTLDKVGTPVQWSTIEQAVVYAAKDQIIWSLGEREFTLFGGVNRASGLVSQLSVKPIISVNGESEVKVFKPSLNAKLLFKRDRNMCAYCGSTFDHANLTRDHIKPASRGGKNTWMNLVTACVSCNCRKDNRTPEEAGMKLLYVPYVPSRYESFILANRNILQDQMEYLLHKVPKTSRIFLNA